MPGGANAHFRALGGKMGIVVNEDVLLLSNFSNKSDVDVIKKLPSRRWNHKIGAWEVPICRSNIKILVKYTDIGKSPEIRSIFNKYVEDMEIKNKIEAIDDFNIDFSKYYLQPYRYQKEGIYFAVISKRAIIADEPGLGKSMQAIIAADQLYGGNGYIIVICPRSLVYNWAMEINKVMGYTAHESVAKIIDNTCIYVASGFSAVEIPKGKKWIICGYSQFTPEETEGIKRTWSSYLISKDIDTLILDEAHKVKNPKANRTRNIRKISKHAKNLIMLSGTLMMNNVEELWSPLNMVSEYDFPKKNLFCDTFMRSYEMRLPRLSFPIKKYYGIKNEDLLKKTIGPFIIRRLKKDVFPQIPPKRRVFIPMGLPEEYRREYNKMLEEFIDYLITKGELEKAAKASRAIQLVQSMELMKFISKMKASMSEDIIEEILTRGKCVAFCLYKSTAKMLAEMFGSRAYMATGDVDLYKRQEVVTGFKGSQDNNLLIMTYGAGSEGFNLEEASDSVMVDFNWVPATMLQAEDRIYRMTSKNSVMVRYLYISDTIDEIVYKSVRDKISSINKVFSMDEDIVYDFIRNLGESNILKGGNNE